MAYENLCMYCFEDRGGESICPHCGRDSNAAVPQIQMLPGSLVYHNRFLVGRALGQDATGIVYSAYDTKRENKLRLREYLPRDCAERTADGSVVPIAGMEDAFEKGMRKLKASVEGVDDPRKRHFYFEENGTAYIAQRKAAAAAAPADDDEGGSGFKSVGLTIAIAAVVVILAAVLVITLVNGALNSADDVVQTPTLAPGATQNLWAPAETPTPTPTVQATFAALVRPDQSWMDYTYSGSVEQDYEDQLEQSSTPVPTIRPETTRYTESVNNNASYAQIVSLQQRLASLGWLSSGSITGSYDAATRQAVKDFQNYVNSSLRPAQKLTVDGIAGPKTQQWLYGTDLTRPTASPTAAVTPKPDNEGVNQNSSKKEIQSVQRKLITLGLLPEGSDDGVYGNSTAAAVKKFQQRVNQLQGYEALPVNGVVDANTLAYLDYYVEWWQNMQQATATPEPVLPTTPSPEPTEEATEAPTSTPEPVEPGGSVDKDSPKESIQYMQKMLIGLGLLPAGSDDGVYGSGTAEAVRKFQQWLNDKAGRDLVSVSGTADNLTIQYLEYAYSNGMNVKPVETPEPSATPEVTPEPTEQPPYEGSEPGGSVDKDSPKESIKFLQQMLIQTGFLPEGSDDGVYGNGTASAVLALQKYVNQLNGEGTVKENGIADHLTLQYLEYAYSNGLTAQPAATPEPSATPDPGTDPEEEDAPNYAVDKDSPKESIKFLQQMLIEVGLLPAGSDDGVFGNGTANAVKQLQQYINATYGEGTVSVSGKGDTLTLSYLEDFASSGTPVVTPTEAPEAPATEISMSIGGAGQSGGVYQVTGEGITFDWSATGDVEYYIYVTDSAGGSFFQAEATDRTKGVFKRGELTPGEVYTIRIGALPRGGSESDMVWTTAKFGVPGEAAPTEEPAPTETPASTEEPVGTIDSFDIALNGSVSGGVYTVTGEGVNISWKATGSVESYSVLIKDSSGGVILSLENTDQTSGSVPAGNMLPGVVYTITVGAKPTGGGEIVWREAKFGLPEKEEDEEQYEPVSAPRISIDGTAYNENGVQYLTGSSAIFTWMSSGDIQGYTLYIVNSSGSRKDLGNTTNTSTSVSLGSMAPDTYRLYVGAVPVNAASADDVVWNSIVFGIPGNEPSEDDSSEGSTPPADNKPTPTPNVTEAPDPDPSRTENPPDLDPSSTENPPDLDPSSTENPPDLDPSSTANPPVLDPSSTANPPVLDPSNTANPPVLDPSNTANPPVLDPFSTANPPVLDPSNTANPPNLDPFNPSTTQIPRQTPNLPPIPANNRIPAAGQSSPGSLSCFVSGENV